MQERGPPSSRVEPELNTVERSSRDRLTGPGGRAGTGRAVDERGHEDKHRHAPRPGHGYIKSNRDNSSNTKTRRASSIHGAVAESDADARPGLGNLRNAVLPSPLSESTGHEKVPAA